MKNWVSPLSVTQQESHQETSVYFPDSGDQPSAALMSRQTTSSSVPHRHAAAIVRTTIVILLCLSILVGLFCTPSLLSLSRSSAPASSSTTENVRTGGATGYKSAGTFDDENVDFATNEQRSSASRTFADNGNDDKFDRDENDETSKTSRTESSSAATTVMEGNIPFIPQEEGSSVTIGTVEHLREVDAILDVVDEIEPGFEMKVYYGDRLVVNGEELTPAQTAEKPNVQITGNFVEGSMFTLIMVDPDAPSPSNPVAREWLHWIVINVPGAGSIPEDGEEITSYTGPTPPFGIHRYVFVLFQQKTKAEREAEEEGVGEEQEEEETEREEAEEERDAKMEPFTVGTRRGFNTKKFALGYKNGRPVAVAYFKARKIENR